MVMQVRAAKAIADVSPPPAPPEPVTLNTMWEEAPAAQAATGATQVARVWRLTWRPDPAAGAVWDLERSTKLTPGAAAAAIVAHLS